MTLHTAAGTTVPDEHTYLQAQRKEHTAYLQAHSWGRTHYTNRLKVSKEHTYLQAQSPERTHIPIGKKSRKNTHTYRYKVKERTHTYRHKVRKEHTYL